MSYFTDLGLAEPILRALGAKGYGDPTPIQRQAIPALLEGRDLLGIAQTGTGKTAAFALPSLHRLALDSQPRRNAACRMLVLSPTRELAAQIAENMRGYAKFLDLSVQCVFGGVPAGKQARALVGGCDVLVATPGRLLDLIDSRALTLRHVEIFVLDEADQMMDLGFIVPLKRIAALLPKVRQSLFFSATMPQAIAELGRQFINDPVKVEVTPQATTAERVEQYATFLNQAEKQALLTLRLREGMADGSIDRALVFTRTKHGADRVVRHLGTAGVEAGAIHGNKSQAQRTAAIQAFRSGKLRVLVATDIAARGIDIPGVSHVFNFEIPNVPEQYVHRIGRTARAGADGIAMSFVAPDEKPYIRDIEKLTGVKLDAMPLPEDFVQQAARLPLPKRKPEGESGGERRDRNPRGGERNPRGGERNARGGERRDDRRNDGRRNDAGRNESRNDGRRDDPQRREHGRPEEVGGWRPDYADRPRGEREESARQQPRKKTFQPRPTGAPAPERGAADRTERRGDKHPARGPQGKGNARPQQRGGGRGEGGRSDSGQRPQRRTQG